MRRNFIFAAPLLLSLSPVLAQTPQAPAADARPTPSPEVKAARQAMRQACMQDAHSLCADQQPGGGKLMMCLRSHKDQVSDGCKSAVQHLRDVRKGA